MSDWPREKQMVRTLAGSAFGLNVEGYPVAEVNPGLSGAIERIVLGATNPSVSTTSINAWQLFSSEELAQIKDMATVPSIDLAPKIQAWLDEALGVYGDGLTGNGGRGAQILFPAGQYLISHLDLRPGVQLIGLSSRFEVQFIQDPTYNADHFITILGHLSNSDQLQRRTEVLLVDISFEANGLLDVNGEPLDCMHSIPEVFDDNTDPDDEVTRTGVIGLRFSCEGASGWGYYSNKRGKNWLKDCQFSRNGTAGKEPNCGGLYVHAPDSAFQKCYSGSNYGHQMHIFSSETPNIFDVEFGVTRSDPTQYVSLYVERCTSFFASGGNSTGPWLIEGAENDTTKNEYGVNCWITIHGVIFSFKDKTFTDHDTSVVKTIPGYVWLKNIKGPVIDMCQFHPAYSDDGTDPMTHTVSHRPTSIIDIKGARTTGVLRMAAPPVDDEMWPAGTPEDSPGGPPADPFGTITNKKEQLSIQLADSTIDANATRFYRLGGLFNDRLEFLGQTEQAGSTVVPKTSMTTVIDVTKARNYVSLGADSTWTFSDAAPTDGTVCAVEVKASGADRTVTLPAGVADATTGETVANFRVTQNKRHLVTFAYFNNNWLMAGYPFRPKYVVDSYATLSAACLDCYTDGAELQWSGQDYTVTGNITNFWDCRHTGKGTITRGTDTFYISPDLAQTNKIYVATTGSDTNDGLTSAFPLGTIQKALNVIAEYAPVLPGRWQVVLAAGTYTETLVFDSLTRGEYPITISGPSVGGHPNVPTAIIQPASTANTILTFAEGRNWFLLSDIKLTGATTGTALNLNGGVRVGLTNVHISGCLTGIVNQHGSMLTASGGIWTGRGKAIANGLALFTTYSSTHAFSGTSSANGVQITSWERGVLVNEGGQGHLDGIQVSDCAQGLTFQRGGGACNTDNVAIDGCDVGVAANGPWFNNGITFGGTTPNTVDVQSRGDAAEFDFCTQDYETHTERLVEADYGILHTGTTTETQVYQFANIRAWMIGEGGHTARVCMAFSQTAFAGTCSIKVYLYDGSTEDFISGVTLPVGTEEAFIESRIHFSAGNAQRGITQGTYKAGATQSGLCGSLGTGAIDTRHTACWIRVKLTLSNAADTATINWLETYGTFGG